MKKKFTILLSLLFVLSTVNMAYSRPQKSAELAEAIKTYKAGNYSQCYYMLENILKKDSSNALAHYYMAITSAQIGKKDEAISNYEAVLMLSPENNNLNRYAAKGKLCLEEPDNCNASSYGSAEDEFIQKKQGKNFSQEVQSDYEKLKLQNFMREMNRKDDVDTTRFNDFKDFSSSVPTNDEIVTALRIFQKAGFGDMLNKDSNIADLSILANPYQGSMYNIMGNAALNPQLIQALLNNNITQGF